MNELENGYSFFLFHPIRNTIWKKRYLDNSLMYQILRINLKKLLNSVINDFFKLKKNMEKTTFKKIIHQVFFIIQLNLFEYEY